MRFPRSLPAFCLVPFIAALPALAAINTDGQRGDLRTMSAETWGQFKLNIGFDANYAQDNDYVKGPVDPTSMRILADNPIDNSTGLPVGIVEPARLFSSNVSACVGLAPFWDVALSLPFYYDWSGFTRDYNDGGVGDLEISTKLRQPAIANILWQSYYLAVTAPTGMSDHGIFPRHAYLLDKEDSTLQTNPATSFYSYSNPIIKGMLLWSLDFGGLKHPFPVSINLNVGAALSTDWQKRNMVIGGLAADYTPASFITLFVDLNAEARWSSFSSGINILRDPFYCSPGLRINAPAGLSLTLAGDFSLSSSANDARNNWNRDGYSYSTAPIPKYGVHFGLSWNGFLVSPDANRCPDDPKGVDWFHGSDGCLDPDHDHDSVCDPWVSQNHLESRYAKVCTGVDQCPNQPEDRDGFQDDDGCPDPDNDKDGIADSLDQCPNLAEDYDGIEDKDGCPDADNDHDGLCDPWVAESHLEAKYANICTGSDRCPNDAEDLDGFEDEDGCPDPDNDHDGIPDIKDLCPNQAETFNGYKDSDGCPDTAPVPPPPKKKESTLPKVQTLRNVGFTANTAEITPDSYVFLDPIVRTLKEFPEVEIEVRTYTDSLGRYDLNMILSQRRAEAVRQYLMNQGADGSRIRAAGNGPNNPIADNRTAAGRAQNRRVEIVRTK